MSVPLEAIAIIGKSNQPIYIKKYKQDQETNLKYDFISHCCIDIIDSLSASKSKDLYLGLLCCMEDVACFGYITNSKIKMVLMVTVQDKTIRDQSVRHLFGLVHNSLAEMIINPFYNESDIKSKKFIKVIAGLTLNK